MKNILVVADIKGWAFDRIFNGLKKNSTGWNIDVYYLNLDPLKKDFTKYNLVLYLCDNFLNPIFYWLQNGHLTKEKILLAIRSEVTHDLYNNISLLNKVCKALITSNNRLYDRFEKLHQNVFLAEGGVDTDFFTFKHRELPQKLRVGWSGSTGVFNRSFRGLDIIQNACDKLDFIFNPALKETKMRSLQEMKEYYHNEIDLYVEMSESAGRQNGLIEAGACGVPVISYNCGIAKELINNENGIILYNRDSNTLAEAIKTVMNNYSTMSSKIRSTIEENWSWKKHTTNFENIFNKCII